MISSDQLKLLTEASKLVAEFADKSFDYLRERDGLRAKTEVLIEHARNQRDVLIAAIHADATKQCVAIDRLSVALCVSIDRGDAIATAACLAEIHQVVQRTAAETIADTEAKLRNGTFVLSLDEDD